MSGVVGETDGVEDGTIPCWSTPGSEFSNSTAVANEVAETLLAAQQIKEKGKLPLLRQSEATGGKLRAPRDIGRCLSRRDQRHCELSTHGRRGGIQAVL